MISITQGYIVNAPTLRQLEYIVALADTGQFVEAARQCAVSQPALSKQIREVEELLGLELFERARPKVIITPAGQQIVQHARAVLAQAHQLMDAAYALSGAHQGTVRLGVIPTIAPYGLPGLLARWRRLYPDVSFAIHELQTEVLVEQLRHGEIDLGLLARTFDDTGLIGPDLVVEPFVLIAPEQHALGISSEINLHDIEGERLILMEDGHCLRDQAAELCAVASRTSFTTVNAASVSTLARMVESGLGATLLPASALRAEVRPGQGLIARSFGSGPPGRTLTLQWRHSSPHSAWFYEIGQVLKTHYLELNASMPQVAGPPPLIRAV